VSLFKLLPLLALAGLGYARRDTVKAYAATAIDMTKVVVTEHEIRNLETAVRAELINGSAREVRSNFPAFVRKVAKSETRDPAKDMWGHEYAFLVNKKHYAIVSRGPDGELGTGDDIRTRIER